MGLFGSEETEGQKWKKSVRSQLKAILTVLQSVQTQIDSKKGFGDGDYQVMVRNIEYAAQQLVLKIEPTTRNNPVLLKRLGITANGQTLCKSLNTDLQVLWDKIGKNDLLRSIPDIMFFILNMLAKIDNKINAKAKNEIYRIDVAAIDRILDMFTT